MPAVGRGETGREDGAPRGPLLCGEWGGRGGPRGESAGTEEGVAAALRAYFCEATSFGVSTALDS